MPLFFYKNALIFVLKKFLLLVKMLPLSIILFTFPQPVFNIIIPLFRLFLGNMGCL